MATVDQTFEGAFAAPLGDPDLRPPLFVDELPTILERFRLPIGNDGKPVHYKHLKGSDRVMISVEEQVNHAASAMITWLNKAGEEALRCDQDPFDEDFIMDGHQVAYLGQRAASTRIAFEYWGNDYNDREDNQVGRFTKWASHRVMRPALNTGRAEVMAGMPKPKAGTFDTLIKPNLSDVAKRKDVRDAAYIGHMNAKIGLAAMRVFTPDRMPFFEAVFTPREPELEAPDLMGLLKEKQEALAVFEFPWAIDPSRQLEPVAVGSYEEEIPF